jgi:hypothetical protein
VVQLPAFTLLRGVELWLHVFWHVCTVPRWRHHTLTWGQAQQGNVQCGSKGWASLWLPNLLVTNVTGMLYGFCLKQCLGPQPRDTVFFKGHLLLTNLI